MAKYAGQKIRVVTAEIRRDGRYLITQRLEKSILPLLWEFPGGKVPEGKNAENVLRTILEEKLGVTIQVGELVMEVVHEYDHYTVDMQVYHCEIPEDEEIQCVGVQEARWVPPSEFASYEFPGADEATITALLDLEEPDLDPSLFN